MEIAHTLNALLPYLQPLTYYNEEEHALELYSKDLSPEVQLFFDQWFRITEHQATARRPWAYKFDYGPFQKVWPYEVGTVFIRLRFDICLNSKMLDDWPNIDSANFMLQDLRENTDGQP